MCTSRADPRGRSGRGQDRPHIYMRLSTVRCQRESAAGYTCTPRLHRAQRRSCLCDAPELAAHFAAFPRGPPANIMFDKRVVRGSTCTGVKNAEIVRAIQEEAEKQAKVCGGPSGS